MFLYDKKYIKSRTGTLSEAQLNKDVIFATDYEGIPYLFSNAEIVPHSKWANEVNKIIKEGNVGIKTVIPHFYEASGQFKIRLLIVFDNDFYTVLEENKISPVKDFKKEFKISFSENIAELYTCNENKVLLKQMKNSGMISDAKITEILKDLKCT